MKCREVHKLLSPYQDGELNFETMTQVKVHLFNCTACQNEEQVLAKTWNTLNLLESVEASPNFKARFWKKVHEEEVVQQTGWVELSVFWKNFAIKIRPAFVFASIVLVSLLGIFVAVHNLPQDSATLNESPIIQWTQSDSSEDKNRGFSL